MNPIKTSLKGCWKKDLKGRNPKLPTTLSPDYVEMLTLVPWFLSHWCEELFCRAEHSLIAK